MTLIPAAIRLRVPVLYGTAPDRREVLLSLGLAVLAAAEVLRQGSSPWLALVCADVAGGIVANTTRSTGAWYAARPAWFRVAFVVLHAGHAALAAWSGGGSWAWAGALFAVMAAGVALVRVVPRGLAMATALAVVVLGSVALSPLPDLPAFGALFLVKLVVGFGVHSRRT